ncbi:MAG TPA: hypothetical protein VG389_01485 [Myxococcota bacterium]|jgi:hypothetical protein|nr:hypothetical protein [Myxococcota bacterium]
MQDLVQSLRAECDRVGGEAHAQAVGILDSSGQVVVEWGDDEYYAVSTQLDIIHSSMAAEGGLDDLLEVGEYSHVESYGDRPSFYLVAVAKRLIVAVVYSDSGDLSHVRQAARAAADRLALLFAPAASGALN